MKDIKTWTLLGACSVILFLVVYFPNKITEKQNAYHHLLEFTGNLQMKEDVYLFNFEINNKIQGLIAPDVPCSATGVGAEVKINLLSDVVQHKPILLYRYKDINCSTCYEVAIKELQTEFADKQELAGILCSYKVDKDLTSFRKLNVIKLPMFRISHDAFDWEVEQYGNPYYFVLHPDMKISNIYVPNKAYPEMNKQYLEGVKRLFD